MKYQGYLIIVTPVTYGPEEWLFVIYDSTGVRIQKSAQLYSSKPLAEQAAQAWLDHFLDGEGK